MDFSLSSDQQIIKESLRAFTQKEFPRDYLRSVDDSEEFPLENWKKFAGLGYCGVLIPEEYGGIGGNAIDMAIIMEELARGTPAFTHGFMTSAVFGGVTISLFGSEVQKREFLPRLAQGSMIISLGATEPNCGTDILALRTYAMKDGDYYVLSGQKSLITNASLADYIITLARTDKESRKKGISLFLVDAKSAGIEIRNIRKMSSKSSPLNEIFYDNVRVSKDCIIGDLNNGWAQITPTLNYERIGIASMALGVAQAAFELATGYSKERTAFGKPIGQFQAIQHILADMAANIETARLMIMKAAWLVSNGRSAHVESAMAKLFASEIGVEVVTKGLQCMGGYGYTMEYNMQRYFRDNWLFPLVPLSNEMIKNLIAESLGFKKSY